MGVDAEATTGTLAPFAPRLVVEWLRDDPETTFRTIEGTLVFADISGFTGMSERLSSLGKAGTEEVTDVMNATFARLLDVAYGEGGTLLKFGGDALLLFFGGDLHAARGTKAAVGMRYALAALGAPQTSAGPVELHLHAAVNSGPFDFFLVGDSHRELVVVGPAVTRTVELEDAGEAGEILVAEATAALLDEDVLGAEKAGGRLVVAAPSVHGTFEPPAELDELPLEQLVPPPIRRHALAAAHESEHRRAAVAFLRFGGTDDLAVDERATRLDGLVRMVQDVCTAHGVTFLESDIDKNGGRIILVAGAPETEGGDDERLLRTLRAIVEAGPPLPLRLGANRGRVFAGLVGTAFRRTYTILGDTAALAARLMAKADDGQILATAAIVERSTTTFDTRELEPFFVKGKSEPVRAFDVGPITGRAGGPKLKPPLVDRQRERALIAASIETVRAGLGSFLELVGEAGIGKSRLTEEIEDRCGDMRRVTTACEQYESSTPYYPFRGLLRSLLDVDDGAALQERVATLDPGLEDWLPLIAIPLDIDVPPTRAVDDLEPSFRRARLHSAITALLDKALETTTLMLFEDVHWMDDASADLLRHLAAHVPKRPWLACTTRRPVDGGFSAGEVPATTLRLEALPEADARELAGLVGQGRGEEELAAITERSGGNPLFLQQLVASDSDELPETIEATLAARIDKLDPGDRALLRWASVLGGSFPGPVIADVLEADTTAAADSDAWDRLSEFVVRDADVPGNYRFQHALIRDAAYDGLSFRRRQELHARVARVYELRQPDDAELLSLHFMRAGLHADTWRYSVAAGRRAQEKWANVEAARFYRRALEAAPNVDSLGGEEIAEVWESLADVLELAGEIDAAATAFDEALARVPAEKRAALMLKAGWMRSERMGRYDEAIEWFERAYPVADDATRLRIAMVHAAARFRQGEFEDCIRRCREILPDAMSRRDLETLAHAYQLLHVLHSMTGSAERAEFRGLALPIYEELGDLVGQARVLNNMGIEAYYEGRWTEALDLYERSRELRRRTGDVTEVAVQTNNIGEILSDQGRLEEAERHFREAREVGDAAGSELVSTVVQSNLGRAAARAGRHDEAVELLSGALERFRNMGAMFVVETEARLAEVAAMRGDAAVALERAEETLAAARQLGGLAPVEALLHRVIGVAHALGGEAKLARASFAESLRIARDAAALFEEAQTLRALGDPGADELYARLGVVA